MRIIRIIFNYFLILCIFHYNIYINMHKITLAFCTVMLYIVLGTKCIKNFKPQHTSSIGLELLTTYKNTKYKITKRRFDYERKSSSCLLRRT